jgi:hypothetical protein
LPADRRRHRVNRHLLRHRHDFGIERRCAAVARARGGDAQQSIGVDLVAGTREQSRRAIA